MAGVEMRRTSLRWRDRVLLDEMVGEERDVRPSVPERRDEDREDVQAVIEILAKRPFRHGGVEIPVRGGDQPNVDGDRRDTPSRSNSRSWRTRRSFTWVAGESLRPRQGEGPAVSQLEAPFFCAARR